MPRNALALALAATAVLAAPSAVVALGAEPASTLLPVEPAVSAAAFVDSVGVNVHTYYDDTAYADSARVTRLVSELGVRHVRDGLGINRPDQVTALQGLAARGIKTDLIVGGPQPGGTNAPDPRAMPLLTGPLAGAVESIEAPNEYDCSSDPSWSTNLRSYSQNLVAAARAAGVQVPIYGPSFCKLDSDVTYGALSGTGDVANLHAYPQGKAPELAVEGGLPRALAAAGTTTSVVTETGYHNATAASWGQPGVSEGVAAEFLPRLLLNNARLGVRRTYLYELFDEKPDVHQGDPEQHFGLVRNDGTPKAGYTAIKNLLTQVARGNPLAVAAPAVRPQGLALQLQGGGSARRHLLVADPSGGGHTLALWLADPRPSLTEPRRSAVVRLQLAQPAAATSYRPNDGGAETPLGIDTAFDVPVDGRVTLLHLSPSPQAVTRSARDLVAGQTSLTEQPLVVNSLNPTTTPVAGASTETRVPSGVQPGVRITGSGQVARVAVPTAPTRWSAEFWARVDPAATSFAGFFHAVGAPGAQIRTYDLKSHPVGHQQFSAYGLPAVGAGYGTETFAQALPQDWHHFTVTNDGSTMRFYVDGYQEGEAGGALHPLTGVEMGALSSGWRGSMAGLAVYGTALSPAVVLRHATGDSFSCPCPGRPTAITPTTPAPTASPRPSTSAGPTAPPTVTPTPSVVPTTATPRPPTASPAPRPTKTKIKRPSVLRHARERVPSPWR